MNQTQLVTNLKLTAQQSVSLINSEKCRAESARQLANILS